MKLRVVFGSALLAAALACVGCAKSGEAPPAGAIVMSVTDEGFVPAHITVKKDQPVNLVITRKTDRTCATEIVIDEYGVRTPLPLNQAVTVSFTPKASGEIQYGCAMDKMIGGVLTIQ